MRIISMMFSEKGTNSFDSAVRNHEIRKETPCRVDRCTDCRDIDTNPEKRT